MLGMDSKPLLNGIWKVWYSVNLLKLSGLGGIQACIKSIKIIVERFQMAVPATFKIHRTQYACLFN